MGVKQVCGSQVSTGVCECAASLSRYLEVELWFSFLLHNLQSILCQDLFLFCHLASVQRAVSDKTVRFMFSCKKIVESRCCILRAALHRALSSCVAPTDAATDTNLQTAATKPELFCFLDFIEVSRNLFSVQLDATDGGQKPVTFGIDEIASLLDLQVKYVCVQCSAAGRGLLGSLMCEIIPNLGQVFSTAPCHAVL